MGEVGIGPKAWKDHPSIGKEQKERLVRYKQGLRGAVDAISSKFDSLKDLGIAAAIEEVTGPVARYPELQIDKMEGNKRSVAGRLLENYSSLDRIISGEWGALLVAPRMLENGDPDHELRIIASKCTKDNVIMEVTFGFVEGDRFLVSGEDFTFYDTLRPDNVEKCKAAITEAFERPAEYDY